MSFLLFHPILLIAVSLDTYILKRLAPFVESYSLHDFCLAMALFFSSHFLLAKRKRDMSGHTPLSLLYMNNIKVILLHYLSSIVLSPFRIVQIPAGNY